MSRIHLVLLIHAHQPVGNFDHVLEDAYQKCYLPFAECLRHHPGVRLGLHYAGSLLEWIDRQHPEYFDLLREMTTRGQVEMVGGGFYEPILVTIPPDNRREQITRLASYLEKGFSARPRGAWLAERVWEPQLPSTFADSGVDYTLVDDAHFLASGFVPQQLFGSYVCEDLGRTVKVIPGLMALRYLIPFRSVEESIDFLRRAANEHDGGMAAMGDDMEKFGVWPETHQHCYTNGWLGRFFEALEANAEWLSVTPPGEYLAAHAPLGRADLPTASYAEMGEWSLPTHQRERFHELLQQFRDVPEIAPFLRGGFWRGFFSKYAESNLLHKKMLHVAGKVGRMAASARRGLPLRRALDDATTHLLRAQCNDAYWHGIFGGIYAPHLRTSLWRELIAAEKLADAAEHGRSAYEELELLDFDADGSEDLYFVSERHAALVKPRDGGTLAALDFREVDVTLVNSIQRRLEPYHEKLAHAADAGGAEVASIHERIRVKESGLEKRLRYDRWARNAFRLLLFPAAKGWTDFETLTLDESAPFAAAPYTVGKTSATRAALHHAGALDTAWAGDTALRVTKQFSFTRAAQGFELECTVKAEHASGAPLAGRAGIEIVLNLLAPNADDRYFEFAGQRLPLSWGGALPGSQVRVADEWQNVAISI
ncbi:MAG TPA: alpha-amylase/4-alpha-glucanotransferase domain-containing protein, partial [Candidatus Acidoferrales bacterium]